MISVVVPLYNEEANVKELYRRLKTALDKSAIRHEILFVDDGSQDNTLGELKSILAADTDVRVVKLSRNFGHQPAISAGLENAGGDAVVVMDGDLQDPPEVIPLLVEKWKEGNQVAYARRKSRKEGLFKRAGYTFFYRLLRWMGNIKIPADSGDFCIMDRKIVNILNTGMTEQLKFIRGLRAYAGFRQVAVDYERDVRASGKAKYTPRKLISLAIDGLLDFSVFPLRIATFTGLFISAASFLTGLFFILHRIVDFKILGHSPTDTPGLASLAVGIFFLGGLILLMLGIIGEYIGRLYFEVKKRPSFIIEEILSQKNNATQNTQN